MKEFIWDVSVSYSFMIFALMGCSEITTLLLRSSVVVKTEYLESTRRPLMPVAEGARIVGLSWEALLVC